MSDENVVLVPEDKNVYIERVRQAHGGVNPSHGVSAAKGAGRNKPPIEHAGTGRISEATADKIAAMQAKLNPEKDPALAKQIVDRMLKGLDPLTGLRPDGTDPEAPAVSPEPAVSAAVETPQPARKYEEDDDGLTELLDGLDPAPVIATVPAVELQAVLQQAPVLPPRVDGGGLRYDAGKNRLELVPPEWHWALGDVTTQGSKKYAERNWERGMQWSKMIGCIFRHVYKFCVGERYDPETGCHHLAMAAWNCLALMSYDLRTLVDPAKPVGVNDIPASTVRILELVNSKLGTIDKKAA